MNFGDGLAEAIEARRRESAAWWYEQARRNLRWVREFLAMGDVSPIVQEHILTTICFAIYQRDVARSARKGVHPSSWPDVPEALKVRKPARRPGRGKATRP